MGRLAPRPQHRSEHRAADDRLVRGSARGDFGSRGGWDGAREEGALMHTDLGKCPLFLLERVCYPAHQEGPTTSRCHLCVAIGFQGNKQLLKREYYCRVLLMDSHDLQPFLDEEGRLTAWPAKPKKQM